MSGAEQDKIISIQWTGPASHEGRVHFLDQREIPFKVDYIDAATTKDIHEAILTMAVRGAPAIGVAGAYGMAIAAFNIVLEDENITNEAFLAKLKAEKQYLDSARPTAVNLEWATQRLIELVETFNAKLTPAQLSKLILAEAKDLAAEDIKINRAIGDNGAALVPQGANIIHHCNTGSLATVGHGTALGVIYSAHEQGKNIHVWVDETRPRLQGARLTTYELTVANVPFHLVPDGASSHLMYEGKVDFVVFGADRVAANGDVANKIGTSNLAICAHEYGIPVYACVPTPTIDISIQSGKQITIENRTSAELTHVGDQPITMPDCPTYNPAFDVTPAKFLTGIITEEGICYPPFNITLPKAKQAAEERIRNQWQDKIKAYGEQTF